MEVTTGSVVGQSKHGDSIEGDDPSPEPLVNLKLDPHGFPEGLGFYDTM